MLVVATDVPPALRSLLQNALKLARQAPSGRILLSRVADLVDPEALPADLRDAVLRELGAPEEHEPMDRKTVERELKDAWGKPPGKVLDDFEAEPLAVRAATQVHRGELDGEAVAVKVRRPGLERSTRNDLALIETLALPLRAALPATDAGALLRELREQVLEEIDLEHQAGMQRRVTRAMRHIDAIVTPAAHTDLAGPAVSVSGLLEGPTLAAGGRPADPAAAAAALLQAHITAARDAGLVLLDARPGHIVCMADGRIGLLGTGVARAIAGVRAQHTLDALVALRDDAPGALADAAQASGLVPPDAALVAHPALRAIIAPFLLSAATLDAAAGREVAARAEQQMGTLFRLMPELAAGPDDLWIARGLGQLFALLARLDATLDWPAVALATPAP